MIIDDVDDNELDLFFFVIENCKLFDVGQYICLVMNEVGKDSCNVDLFVIFIFEFLKILDVVEIFLEFLEGQDVILKVLMSVDYFIVSWFKDDEFIIQSDYYNIDVKEGIYILTIKDVFFEDLGIYICEIIDDSMSNFNVIIKGNICMFLYIYFVCLYLIFYFCLFKVCYNNVFLV